MKVAGSLSPDETDTQGMVDKATRRLIALSYRSKPGFTKGQTVRAWFSDKPADFQPRFGREGLRNFGVLQVKGTSGDLELDQLVERYAENLARHARFLAAGDYKRGNPISDDIRRDILLIAEYGSDGAERLSALLRSPDLGVRLGVATDLLGYQKKMAVHTLEEIASCGSVSPLLQFTAKQTLDAWFRGELDSKF